MAHWLNSDEGKDLVRRCRGLNGGLAKIGQPLHYSSAERRALFAAACDPTFAVRKSLGLALGGMHIGRKAANAPKKRAQYQQNRINRNQ